MKKDLIISLFLGLVAASLLIVLLASMTMLVMRSEMKNQGREILSYLLDLDTDVQKTWGTLASYSDEFCSDQHLRFMRHELLHTWHLKDIIFYRDEHGVFCSAAFGRMKNINLPAPSFQTPGGAKIWIGIQWPDLTPHPTAALALQKHYMVAVDAADIERFIDIPFQWQMTFEGLGVIKHTAGNPTIRFPPPQYSWILGVHQVHECSDQLLYCVTTQHSGWQFMTSNRLMAILILIVSYLLGWLSYARTKRYFYDKRSLRTRILKGLKNGAFFPVFQPIVRLNDESIVGCEVLARFTDKLGSLSPDQFIPIIGSEGKSWQFTQYIINAGTGALNTAELKSPLDLSFNIFPQDIASGEVLALPQMPCVKNWHGSIHVEITEDQYLDQDTAHGHLYQLEKEGIKIAIDDFGTGYSNLHSIDKLHCDFLKIDRSFINDMEQGSVRSSLIPHIIEIAKQADLAIVAEGVENLAQASQLKKMGVEYVQGFYFGKPMTCSHFLAFIHKNSLRNRLK